MEVKVSLGKNKVPKPKGTGGIQKKDNCHTKENTPNASRRTKMPYDL